MDKNILFNALKCRETERPGWVPFVGVHGGFLIGKNANEYLKSADLIVEGLNKAIDLYKPDGIPIVFDLQLEAEVLGCELQWHEETPPSVVSHPLQGDRWIDDLSEFDTGKGRLPLIEQAGKTIAERWGSEIVLYGLVTGPFTLSAHLRGSELFYDLLTDPNRVHELMEFTKFIGYKMVDFYIDIGCEVVAIVDPMTSQISPHHFHDFVAPYLNYLFEKVREQGVLGSLFVCGDATKNLEIMCRTMCHQISIDENIPLELACKIAHAHGKSIGGNLRLTSVLLFGKPADAKLDAIRCIDTGGTKGFVLSPGCDIPYSVPPENLEAVAEMVQNAYQRQVARATLKPSVDDTFDDIQIPDYSSQAFIQVDCITLDSTACAPCLFTVDCALKAKELCSDLPVVVKEHKIKSREGMGYMKKLGIQSIPAICIDGKLAFSSTIPDAQSLAQLIQNEARKKLSM
ncbi:MAG: uroporphyrinogen decarboxylase [Candidatus Hydrogenedentes bacterium]|nr:uroporphyrinogen decarboxylase [Candidatus Hydrogenedentota bacterium]